MRTRYSGGTCPCSSSSVRWGRHGTPLYTLLLATLHVPVCTGFELAVRSAPWTDSFRGAERAVTLVAEDAATGQRLGSLGLEELALRPAEVDGFAAADDGAPRPLLSGLVVEPAYRRRGVARELVSEAEKQARAWGHAELLLYVDDANAAAVRFYDAIGFRCAADGARCVAGDDGVAVSARGRAPGEQPAESGWQAGALAWLRDLGRGSRLLFLRKALP